MSDFLREVAFSFTIIAVVLTALVSMLALLAMSIYVPPNHLGVYFKNGSSTNLVLKSGWTLSLENIFLLPYEIQHKGKKTNLVDIRVFSDPVNKYPVLCASRLQINITGSALVRIFDIEKAVTTVVDLDQCIDAHCKAELRNQFSSLTVDEIITKQETIEEELKKALNKDLNYYGVQILGFILSEVHLHKSITDSVQLVTAKQAEYTCLLLEAQNKYDYTMKELATNLEIHKGKLEELKSQKESELQHLKNLISLDPSLRLKDYLQYKALKERYESYGKIKGNLILSESDNVKTNFHN